MLGKERSLGRRPRHLLNRNATPPSHLSAAPTYPPQPRAARNRTAAPQRAQGEEEETQQRSEGTQQRKAAAAAVPPRLCSSSSRFALATNSGSLAPAHDSSTPQEVAAMFHRQFSSTSHRTVISPPLLLSSEVSTIDCLRIHLYIGIALSTGPPTHGRDHVMRAPITSIRPAGGSSRRVARVQYCTFVPGKELAAVRSSSRNNIDRRSQPSVG
mgnify:CR=1 FL=1